MLLEAECIYKQNGLQSTGTLPLAEQAVPYLPDDMPRLSLRAICRYESDILGYMVSAHPLDFVRTPRGILPARDIRTKSGRKVRMVGWMISAKLLDTRTDGKPMKMLSMEDETGTFEAVLFPRIYEKYAARTLTSGPYLIEGRVDMKLGSPTLNVERLSLLDQER